MDANAKSSKNLFKKIAAFISGKFNFIYDKINKSKLPPFFKRKSVVISIPILFLLLIVFIVSSFQESYHNVPVYKVVRDNFVISITESGELRAKNSISIKAPRTRGTLKIVYLVPEGTYVKAGDVLVKFDPVDAMQRVRDEEQKYEVVLSDRDKLLANHKSQTAKFDTQLQTAEISFEQSKLNLEKVKFEAQAAQQEAQLNHKKNELSYEQTKTDVASSKIIQKSELEKQALDVRQREQELKRAKDELESLTLKAPGEGLVVYGSNWDNQGRKFQIGNTAYGGANIIELPDLSLMESVTYVNEVDVSKVKKGLKVQVKMDAFQDSTYLGEISDIASIGRTKDQNSKLKVYEVLIKMKQRSDKLKPGMTTGNKMIVREIPNVIFVPIESIFEKNGKKIVFVKNGSGFDLREVEVGDKGEDYIIIRSGLRVGEEVALVDPFEKADLKSETENKTNVQMPGSEKK
jgi:RND family efflux transporter MFP subunit